jgi:hypothetical protein
MYLYAHEDLGECSGKWVTPGPGISPVGAQAQFCPLVRDLHGGYLDWQNYVVRTANPKDPLSRFKQFINEDCYRAYLESCKRDTIQELVKGIRPLPVLKAPLTPPPGFCLEKCRREAQRCPGGRRDPACRQKFRDCMKDCEGVLV